ncbi:hypothetical protein LPB136_11580 [Tenacibaculum todarodis]|uniref:Gliding motility protein n=1 Tax=Tenacibaculum todarodis TaxID=1850252 RepID=A0A1L3JMZ4_9FLAO|nr:tetratricopeptide repeat protein [Tenacibaculum todarodis]APG66491.1 hypothetical protein LPB136_11580 [Tenacibaculum todarodis]
MKNLKKTVLLAVLLIAVLSCSTRKDTLVSRNFHALTTKYNVLFNGEQAFIKGLEEISSKHKDNYWKRLLIEPITFEDTKIQAPKFKNSIGEEDENKNLTSFELAEEKAIKAVQKHSMNIKGRERNRQIDDAYLLLGKSRYYTQRFIPALEALNYVIAEYPDANLINETKIWRAKTNIRLENEKLAIESLKLLLDVQEGDDKLTDEIKEQAHTAMAMAYAKTDTIQKVIEHLTLATRTHENKEQTARNLFILGQVYSELDRKDSAIVVFQKLADFKKMPYKYRIHSNIELVKNTSADSSSVALIKRFEKLIKNRDNRPYLDKLYYHVAVLHENQDSIADAISYYQKSLKAKDADDYQKTYTFEKLGDIHFKNAEFIKASVFYDSVLQVATEDVVNEKRIRKVKRRHKSLASLGKYENVLKINDSILHIANLPEGEQKIYFENYIAKIKKQDEENAQQQLNALSFGNSFGGGSSISTTNNSGKWYFYNTQAKAFGEAEFQRVWGTRSLEDNWRWSDKTTVSSNDTDVDADNQTNKRYELATYLETIPTDKVAIDSLTFQRNDALYQLGLIYKEQFKNPQLAIKNLERLQTVNTDERLNLPINYHLYQIYTSLNSPKANEYKNVILTKYPDTKYAQIIKYPTKKLAQDEEVDKIADAYKDIYYLYKENKFDEVITKIDVLLPTILESNLLPKFDLLKAYAIGKIKDKETYKTAMEFVALTYANTEEGKKAKEIVKQLN